MYQPSRAPAVVWAGNTLSDPKERYKISTHLGGPEDALDRRVGLGDLRAAVAYVRPKVLSSTASVSALRLSWENCVL